MKFVTAAFSVIAPSQYWVTSSTPIRCSLIRKITVTHPYRQPPLDNQLMRLLYQEKNGTPCPPMVYDGANDGMLHAFRADTGNGSSGKELFAYVPAAVYGNLSSLTETDYTHKYFVDGSPTVGDAYLSGAWKTVLLGGLGNGGKAIYALNISTPDAFTDAHVLWEYSGSTAAIRVQPALRTLMAWD